MQILAALAALALLVAVLAPVVSRRLRAARRGRAVHLGGSCHWYANYDDQLHYEPKRRSDIIRLTRAEILGRGYRPTEDARIIPRTFRNRVPGDTKIRLWTCDAGPARSLWLCEWANDPVRLAIGVNARERVPGVERASLPIEAWTDAESGSDRDARAALGSWHSEEGDGQLAEGVTAAGSADWGERDRAPERGSNSTTESGQPLEAQAAVGVHPDEVPPGNVESDAARSIDAGLGGDTTSSGGRSRGRERRRRRRHR